MSHQRTWLITGVSSGFGRVMTEQLLAGGEAMKSNWAVVDLLKRVGD